MAVKAIACELPATLGMPLSRSHVLDIRQVVLEQGLVADISGATIWRWLTEDTIKPWTHRSWIFPRSTCRSLMTHVGGHSSRLAQHV